MVTLAEACRMALSLPEATEEDHHGIPSFRVGNKIFATVPDDEHLRIMFTSVEACCRFSPAAPASVDRKTRQSGSARKHSTSAGRFSEGTPPCGPGTLPAPPPRVNQLAMAGYDGAAAVTGPSRGRRCRW